MYDAVDDPYTYENSTVLVNKLGLREQPALDAFEAEISSARAEEPLPEGVLDFTHYKAVHHHLFQDVYEWAGQVRTIRLFKGGNPFCFPENIEGQAARLFNELKEANYFRGGLFAQGRAFSGRIERHPCLPRGKWPIAAHLSCVGRQSGRTPARP
jgi:cell filamentation protein